MAILRYSTPSRPNLLVIGAGSIGRRHAKNLKALGAVVHLFDVNIELLSSICREEGFTPCVDIDNAIETSHFDGAIVCTPTHLHLPVAKKVAGNGINLFIEKPLSHTLEGVDDLITLVENNHCISMVGFMLRFEPGLQYLKAQIEKDKVAFGQAEFGSHMPLWRKGVDYRKVYSANRSMGGGAILDDVHELDYVCWLLGYPKHVTSVFGKFSSFEMDVEDTAMINFEYTDKIVSIHSDYLQRKYSRKCKICDRDGYTFEWIFGNSVRVYSEHGEHVFSYADTFGVNQLYIDEMRYFLECIEKHVQPESGLYNGKKIMEIALAAKHEYQI
jgi:predicted dehydrogenase